MLITHSEVYPGTYASTTETAVHVLDRLGLRRTLLFIYTVPLMPWWIWVLLGLVLLVAEVATPGGFFAFFFGLSGLAVGGLVAIGLAGPIWLQWLLFGVIAVAALGMLRGPLRARFDVVGSDREVDSLVGARAIVTAEIPGAGQGKVELRGSSWNARSAAGRTIGLGRHCTVTRVDGLTLWVTGEIEREP
jgi:membrane protein implicated in regulation of membrane protease activity